MASSRTRRATGRLMPKRPQMMFVVCGLDSPTRSPALVRRAEADEQLGDRPISGAQIRAVRHTRLFGDSRQRASRTSQLSADPARRRSRV